jgi:hypothetical protein
MEETFLMALDEVRVALRLHRDMGEQLILLLLEKEELGSDEVEAFFDQFGFFTPKPALGPGPEPAAVAAVEHTVVPPPSAR